MKGIIALLILMIFVGISILIGISVYRYQQYQSNQKSLEIDMNHFSTQVFAYWKTPYVGGGAGGNLILAKKERLADFIGFSHVIEPAKKADYYSGFTLNGEIRLVQVSSNTVILKGLGKVARKGEFPLVQCTINLYTFTINTTIGTAKSF